MLGFVAVHPHLHFISHIPLTIKGEQLMAQFLRCIPDHGWLYTWGRMPMSIIMGEWVWSVRLIFSKLGVFIILILLRVYTY